MARPLENREIVISGSSGALGRAVVARLVEDGAICHLPLLEADVPPSLSLHSEKQVHFYPEIDLTLEKDVESVFEGVRSLWASVHLTGGFRMSALARTSVRDVEVMWKLNALTCFLCCRAAITRMSEAGRIVNVGAKPVIEPTGGMSAYVMSKGAVVGLTKDLAAEVSERGICVNAILPSVIDTPANRSAMPDADWEKWPKPSQIADTISFLVSTESRLVSGATVPVYGQMA